MSDGRCPRCHLPGARHELESGCIAALGAALAALGSDVEELKADLAVRRAQEERARELHAEAEADLARGG